MVIKMARLKYYENERKIYAAEFYTYVDSQDHVTQIVHKLCRHFGVPKILVHFTKCRRGSACYKRGWERRLDFSWGKTYPIDIATICHEMGHYYLDFTNKPCGHTKRLTKIQDRMLKYCVSKDYWGWTIKQRVEVPTKSNKWHILTDRWNNLTLEQRKAFTGNDSDFYEMKFYVESCEKLNKTNSLKTAQEVGVISKIEIELINKRR
jgi:hypothetical protein